MARPEYWQRRDVRAREILFDKGTQAVEKRLQKEYLRSSQKVIRSLKQLYDDITKGNEHVTVNDLYQYDRYYEMLNALNNELTRLGSAQKQIIGDDLADMYNDTKALLEPNGTFAMNSELRSDLANTAINRVWCADGKTWSDRIWWNKDILQELLTTGLTDALARGDTTDAMIRTLMKAFDTSYSNAQRLVRTEMNYIQNQAIVDKFREDGIEKFEFLAELDERTCSECEALDGKIYLLSAIQVGKNCPPIHPNCRCTILAVIDGATPEPEEKAEEPKPKTLQEMSSEELRRELEESETRREAIDEQIFEAMLSGDKELSKRLTEEGAALDEKMQQIRQQIPRTERAEVISRSAEQIEVKNKQAENILSDGYKKYYETQAAQQDKEVSGTALSQKMEVDFTKMSAEIAHEHVEMLKTLEDQFPSHLTKIIVEDTEKLSARFNGATGTVGSGGFCTTGNGKAQITLQEAWHKLKAFNNSDYLINVKPEYVNVQTLVHEYGHSVFTPNASLAPFGAENVAAFRKASDEMSLLYNKYLNVVRFDESKMISTYSLTTPAEFFAEAFTNHMIGQSPNEFAEMAVDIVNKYIYGRTI